MTALPTPFTPQLLKKALVASGFEVFRTLPEEVVLAERVRKLAEPALANGFTEVSTNVNAVKDPADPERTLDTFYEVFLAREVATFEDAIPVLKFALSLEKAVASVPART